MSKISLTEYKIKRLLILFHKGYKYSYIANKLCISISTVSRFIKSKGLTFKDRIRVPQTNPPKIKIGKKYNNITIIGIKFNNVAKRRCWHVICKCDCGIKFSTIFRSIEIGGRKTCGETNCKYHKQILISGGRHNFTGYKDIHGNTWKHYELGAYKRNLSFKVKIQYAHKIYIKQNKKCALSGIPIIFAGKNYSTASLDRIDSNKGYIKNNIQWVYKPLNAMKGSLSDEDFINFCKHVALWNS
jgi:hypothetical protein